MSRGVLPAARNGSRSELGDRRVQPRAELGAHAGGGLLRAARRALGLLLHPALKHAQPLRVRRGRTRGGVDGSAVLGGARGQARLCAGQRLRSTVAMGMIHVGVT